MSAVSADEILKLPVEERLELVEVIWESIRAHPEELGYKIESLTPVARWYGDVPDYSAAIDGLLRKNQEGIYAEDVSAETRSEHMKPIAVLVEYGAD